MFSRTAGGAIGRLSNNLSNVWSWRVGDGEFVGADLRDSMGLRWAMVERDSERANWKKLFSSAERDPGAGSKEPD